MLDAIQEMLSCLLAVLVALSSPPDRPSPAQTKLTVTLELRTVSAKKYRSGDCLLRCKVTLHNDTRKPLKVRTSFGSVFDGLEVVVMDSRGKVLTKQPFTFHQSPRGEPREFVAKQGMTKGVLVFPISKTLPLAKGIEVRLIGGLPGCEDHTFLSTESVAVTEVEREGKK